MSFLQASSASLASFDHLESAIYTLPLLDPEYWSREIGPGSCALEMNLVKIGRISMDT